MKRRFITSLTSIIIVSLILTIGTISVQAAEKNENKINQNLSIKNGNADFISSVDIERLDNSKIAIKINTNSNYNGNSYNISVRGPGSINNISTNVPYHELDLTNYGTYNIYITVTDIYGISDSYFKNYHYSSPIQARFFETVDKATIGDEIKFNVISSGGNGSHKYKFYTKDGVIKEYSYNSSLVTKFNEYGEKELFCDIKDEDDTVKTISHKIKVIANEPAWKNENNKWYYVNDKGEFVKGWLNLNNVWYYLDGETGEMKTGLQDIGGYRYYFDESGYMKTGWINYNGEYRFFGSDGAMRTGWVNDGWTDYYLKSDGTIYKGWLDDGLNKYYMDENGQMRKGWVNYNGKYYFFGPDGAMRTGWINDGWTDYYLKPDGTIFKGWLDDGLNKYYMDENGQMRKGWVKHNGEYYFFGPDGAMRTGWINDGYAYYFLNNNGTVKKGWFDENGIRYYLGSDGAMRTGWQVISDNWYHFNNSGAMSRSTSIDGWKIDKEGIATPIKINSTVYVTPNGTSYHYSRDCTTLKRSHQILSMSLDEAKASGKNDPCNVCVK
ncbi:N-acetylmuramoyl-L-alanine amidase family protein [Clostridium perfringens]|uniref:N-acetylmuramoyl-L-alanine amidase family protein n=1 Tax=Clostridium perfringens TaxID=1502 RepID=UPI00242F0BEC|nr:hypothetical protein [Clostridium perfringens]MDM0973000.1 hypothetical protein [Clostridium perfringens]MDU2325202.1 hypothetical protein [Clostridium perfringens]